MTTETPEIKKAQFRDVEVEETDADECAELSDLPCFECWMRERGFEVEGSA